MKVIFEKLKQYKNVMDFNPPISSDVICKWNKSIPLPLMELYRFFNGGEIFVPGTQIFGLTGQEDDIINFNYSQKKILFDIPKSYMIFARLNFGDYICINTKRPFDLIQWDHENNEEYNSWDSLEEWLTESIEDYADYLHGEC